MDGDALTSVPVEDPASELASMPPAADGKKRMQPDDDRDGDAAGGGVAAGHGWQSLLLLASRVQLCWWRSMG